MAVPTLRAGVGSGDSSQTSLAVSKPTGTASGDLLVCVCLAFVASSVVISLAAGTGATWTQIPGYGGTSTTGNLYSTVAFAKIANGSEPTSWTMSWTGSAKVWRAAYCSAFQGAVSPLTFDPASGSYNLAAGTGAVGTGPSITTTIADDLIAAMYATGNGGSWSVTAGSDITAIGNIGSCAMGYKGMPTIGATNQQQETCSVSTGQQSGGLAGFVSATAPAGATAPPPHRQPWRRWTRARVA